MSEFYHQLTTLLKSTAAAARMTPMHRYYVKKQSADTFVILYKVDELTLHLFDKYYRYNQVSRQLIWDQILKQN